MKKLSIISNQIKNNTYSYTGKGSFEAIVNNNKDLILEWLEDLIPLQKQIDMLRELENLDFQKRNYTRILTKIFPEEYKEFVSLNILVRDANIIAQYYADEFNITLLYDKLLDHKYLKYPGKYDKYVEYKIFQKFLMMYKDDLSQSLESQNQSIDNHVEPKQKEIILDSKEDEEMNATEEKNKIEKETTSKTSDEKLNKNKEIKKESKSSKKTDDKDTNWTQLLLGKLK